MPAASSWHQVDAGKWEQDSAALDGTLQLLRRQLGQQPSCSWKMSNALSVTGGQMQVLTLDASSLPGHTGQASMKHHGRVQRGVAESLQLGDLPAAAQL